MADNFDEARLRAYLADPNVLLDDIDYELDKLPIEEIPLSVLSSDPTFEKGYRKVSDSRPHHLILDAILNQSHASLKELCCVRCRYCEIKREHSETINLVKALIDAWASTAILFPLPIATVATYCVQSLFLDHLCDC
jgi:hypothetical protein